MALHTGMGEYVYEVVENWGKLPGGWTYDIAGVGIDGSDRVYLFNRSERPIIVVDGGATFSTVGAISRPSPMLTR
jgi:hypothetical protein